MEQEIKNRYNDGILQTMMRRYDILPEQIKLLDGFESYMYEFEKAGSDFILRIGHSRRRTEAMIQAEVDWINFLAAGGAGVARAVLSAEGNLVEAVADAKDGHFLGTAFVKAQGNHAQRMQMWNEQLFVDYGRLIGKMHRLTKDYVPSNPAWKRPAWDSPENMEVEQQLPQADTAVLARYQTLMHHLQSLPKGRESYGLIHQDAHNGNFFVDAAGQITLFDFDDSTYGHYAYDIAMVLFYAVTNRADADEFAPQFWRPFWQGYCEENQLDPIWLKEIPHFLKLREIDLYAIIHRSFDLDNLNDGWVAQFMNGRKQNIEQDVPYIKADFLLKKGMRRGPRWAEEHGVARRSTESHSEEGRREEGES